jgi:UDP-glucuronate 4-epimerase
MTVLVTGVAGFIGARIASFLLEQGEEVIGVDNLNDYYSPKLKQARLALLEKSTGFRFFRLDIATEGALPEALSQYAGRITHVLHFAAQAGVRYSMDAPSAFVRSNVAGHVAVLEFARHLPKLEHVVYASSSSVYGRNTTMPFRETDRVDLPGSFYAATKRMGELTSESYNHLYGLPLTGLRLFTVYGPWGRPDMACFKFAEAIFRGEPVSLYSGDGLARDFTYVDDVVEAVLRVMGKPPEAGARILNIGNNSPVLVRTLISLLGEKLGKEPKIALSNRPAADVVATWASVEAIRDLTGWIPETDLESGLEQFVRWFKRWMAV